MFNRPCKFFGTCHLHSFDSPAVREEDEIVYDFIYDLDGLIEDHVERINNEH